MKKFIFFLFFKFYTIDGTHVMVIIISTIRGTCYHMCTWYVCIE
jgi:hypothetical protein